MNRPDRTLFNQAVQLYKNGDRHTARVQMRQALLADPSHVQAWLWMSALVDEVDQQRECLERALALDPQCEPAIRGLEILGFRQTADMLAHNRVKEGSESGSQGQQEHRHARQARQIGDYLVERGLISIEELDEALEEQRHIWKSTSGSARVPLGDILVKQGLLTPEMLARVLLDQQEDKLHSSDPQSPQYIGEYLVSNGLITPPQLEAVLAEQIQQRQEGKSIRIGDLLVHGGYISAEALDDMLEQKRAAMLNRFHAKKSKKHRY
jgi:hypothetical protein